MNILVINGIFHLFCNYNNSKYTLDIRFISFQVHISFSSFTKIFIHLHSCYWWPAWRNWEAFPSCFWSFSGSWWLLWWSLLYTWRMQAGNWWPKNGSISFCKVYSRPLLLDLRRRSLGLSLLPLRASRKHRSSEIFQSIARGENRPRISGIVWWTGSWWNGCSGLCCGHGECLVLHQN